MSATPQSRNKAILQATIDGTEYTAEPQSRIEALLLELKAAIENSSQSSPLNIEQMIFSNANVQWMNGMGGGFCSVVKLFDLPDDAGKKRFLGSFYLGAQGSQATAPTTQSFYNNFPYDIKIGNNWSNSATPDLIAYVKTSYNASTDTATHASCKDGGIYLNYQTANLTALTISIPLCMFIER